MSRKLFAELGLAADADERAVKRAYARLLKGRRPDDDPVGFQRLHEVYQRLLEIVRTRAPEATARLLATEADASDEDTSHGVEADFEDAPDDDFDAHYGDEEPWQAAPIEGSFNLGAFLSELETHGRAGSAAELRHWLHQHPGLYSLALKASITVPVLDKASDLEPPLPVPALEEILAFFGAERLRQRDWWVLEKVELLCQRERLRDSIERRTLPGRGVHESWIDDLVEDEITARPHREQRLRRLFLALAPGLPTRVQERIQALDEATDGAIDEFIPADTRAFYRTLTDRSRVTSARAALTIARTLLGFSVFPIMLLVLGGHPKPVLWLEMTAWVAGFCLAWQVARAWVTRALMALVKREDANDWLHRAGPGLGLGLSIATACAPWDWLRISSYYLVFVTVALAAGDTRRIPGLMLGGLLLAVDLMLAPWGLDVPYFWRGFAGLALAVLAIMAWDEVHALRKGRSLEELAKSPASLWPLVIVVAVLTATLAEFTMRL